MELTASAVIPNTKPHIIHSIFEYPNNFRKRNPVINGITNVKNEITNISFFLCSILPIELSNPAKNIRESIAKSAVYSNTFWLYLIILPKYGKERIIPIIKCGIISETLTNSVKYEEMLAHIIDIIINVI